MPTTPERRAARTSGANPSYSKVVPAPEFSLNVAVTGKIGRTALLRKGLKSEFRALLVRHFPDDRAARGGRG
ncbi:hypothetical protein, partial [Bradyrhizobium sp. WBOS16]|uniref:hypothetical protein n=1 Tax=Bradyrhizobium sp. WBOS16 TaxID=1390141 RepID=UPI0023644749